MRYADLLQLVGESLRAQRLRTFLTALGIAIGIGAVVLLTSIGEGVRRYVQGRFSEFGTNLVGLYPGRTETWGMPGLIGGAARKITLADIDAIRRVPGVTAVVPISYGMARLEREGRSRDVFAHGVTHDAPAVWNWGVHVGMFLPEGDPEALPPVCVLGTVLAGELFGNESPLGKPIRVGGARFRVVGVMEPKGEFLGVDLDDFALIPIGRAMALYDRDEIDEVDFTVATAAHMEGVVEEVRRVLTDRHRGEEDFTIITQDEMLRVLENVMGVLTMAVGAIAGISLLVGAIGILTVLWISVHERTAEVGLEVALGARRRQILQLFLAEAAALALAGGAAGLALGIGGAGLLSALVPGIPTQIHPLSVPLALLVSVATGLGAGVLPAFRAARLDPVEALRGG